MNKIIHYITRPFYKIFSIWQGMSTTLKFLICGICLIVGSTATIISFGHSTASKQTEIKANQEEDKSGLQEYKACLKWTIDSILNYENEKFSLYKLSDINAHYNDYGIRIFMYIAKNNDNLQSFYRDNDINGLIDAQELYKILDTNSFLIANGIKLLLSGGQELKLLVMHQADSENSENAHIILFMLINYYKTNATSSKLGELQEIVDNHCDSQDLSLKDILTKGFYNQLAELDSNTSFSIFNNFFRELNDAFSPARFKDFQTTLTNATKHLNMDNNFIQTITKIEITTKIYYKDK